MPPPVVIERLRYVFPGARGTPPTVALDALTTRIEPGIVTGLVGPDAAGKTTLLRLMAGLLRPGDGRITVLGHDMATDASAAHSSIGYMPQRFGLYEDLTVAGNLDLFADLHVMSPALRAARIPRLLQFTGLTPFIGRLAGKLSGGMKQKLGLACALLSRPRLLLLDEPSVGVDPASRRELWAIVTAMLEEGRADGMAVVWATAYLDEAARCGRVLLLHQGRLLADEPPDTFIAPLAGRVFRARITGGSRRAAERRIAHNPAVLDAVVGGDALRVVLREGASADALQGETLDPLPPRFEDSFIARLATVAPSSGATIIPEHASPSAAGQVELSPPAMPSTMSAATPPPPIASPVPLAKPPHPAPQAAARSHSDEGSATALQTRPTTSHASEGPAIAVQGLVRTFGTFTAVDHISFEVARGEIFGLLGPNGAGKSTTFRMLCGLLRPSGGTARVAGQDLLRAPAAARARIGYMAQRFSLYGELTVLENLRFFARVYGLDRAGQAHAIAQALQRFDLTPMADTVAGQLPLGVKQRLALSAALLHGPDILFLDEPTSGVDPLTRREFWSRIGQLADAGVTILVTTHFMDEAEYCDRLAIVNQGRLAAVDTPAALRARVRRPDLPDPTLEDAFVTLVAADTTSQERAA
jgi:ABC-type multidrug transport system ATPase subunit